MGETHEPAVASRYVVGIDLGTTNSALAYVDTREKAWAVRDLTIPQLVAPATVEGRATLPSFDYEAAAGEFPPGALRLPWDAGEPRHAVGVFARDHGAASPGRLVASAKSWLCHPGVDRTAGLLPWHGAADVERLSPVAVSARYLGHLRSAWDARFPGHPLALQDVALTVPASFDEVARELTVEAAVAAGLERLVLVEEPQAAFYAWIDARTRSKDGGDWGGEVSAGQRILVCDVGGGTSDFTLIQVRPAEAGKVLFHRVAVGEHLILGGDNLDLALAHHVEKKLSPGGRLAPRQWGQLVRTCRAVKELLLGNDPPEKTAVSVTGGGSKLVGASLQAEVTRGEVEELLLEGFLPRVPLDAEPDARRSGFQEFGLPYAPDPAITKYLAAFLTAHAAGESDAPGAVALAAWPDVVLFNGGLFDSPVLRERLLEVLGDWFTPPGSATRRRPHVLRNDRLDLAVARGAAYYGMVRRGHGTRISGGTAHSYYVGVDSGAGLPPTAVCLLPAGVEEGQGADLTDRVFELLIRQPVEFPLYVSSTRTGDKAGELVPVDARQTTALPPIRTVLQSGKKGTADVVRVSLHARRTEIGTLDLWCQEQGGDRKWRLQFDVRSAVRPAAFGQAGATSDGTAEAKGVLDERVVAACPPLIRQTFHGGSTLKPESLVKRLEQETGMTRWEWPSSLLRSFWETLIEVEDGRKLGVDHEARWLSFAGFSLRPGYGLAVDDWRVRQTWRLFPAKVTFTKNELVRAEWWILWRRVAGGLALGQQQTLAEPLVAALRDRLRFEALARQTGGGRAGLGGKSRESAFQFGPHETAEVFRLLGSLELLRPEAKVEIGNLLLDYLTRDRAPAVRHAAVWAVGRTGARVPMYGPLNLQVPAEVVAAWAGRLMAMTGPDESVHFAVVQMTRRTDDRYRDVDDTLRGKVLDWLAERHAAAHYSELVRNVGRLREDEQKSVFGETLPKGLRIE